MRTIKFRAWDKKNNKMSYFKNPSFQSEYNKMVFDVEAFQEESEYDAFGDLDISHAMYKAVNIMQFTGLLDKNGKEIYEGDIVKHTVYDEYGDSTDYNCEVVFGREAQPKTRNVTDYPGSFCIINESFYKGVGLIGGPSDSSEEIIGNIYENPELLS